MKMVVVFLFWLFSVQTNGADQSFGEALNVLSGKAHSGLNFSDDGKVQYDQNWKKAPGTDIDKYTYKVSGLTGGLRTLYHGKGVVTLSYPIVTPGNIHESSLRLIKYDADGGIAYMLNCVEMVGENEMSIPSRSCVSLDHAICSKMFKKVDLNPDSDAKVLWPGLGKAVRDPDVVKDMTQKIADQNKELKSFFDKTLKRPKLEVVHKDGRRLNVRDGKDLAEICGVFAKQEAAQQQRARAYPRRGGA